MQDRHLPGFEVATEVENFRESNTKFKDYVNNVESSLLIVQHLSTILLYKNSTIKKWNIHTVIASTDQYIAESFNNLKL